MFLNETIFVLMETVRPEVFMARSPKQERFKVAKDNCNGNWAKSFRSVPIDRHLPLCVKFRWQQQDLWRFRGADRLTETSGIIPSIREWNSVESRDFPTHFILDSGMRLVREQLVERLKRRRENARKGRRQRRRSEPGSIPSANSLW